ncbi:cobalt-precorrin-5B (C(1))-methyltransferase CbiD [Methanobrevibacter olleyae]|uniref:Cobalt-precorrin-5B C(1)-methyltransferase n=1 Tax=Methanobrevibacter olleyae TaxID=294671 RepID=A0A126QZJ0_METOL|nr:cobalt-precorrin-5B (C(1))-methyltransferase CbiD [Methanobrevibacter olleyae]AMK14795.1 cobalamin biosynthesis protein CbiD [Methanobrevibacter olleyae]SFL36168.1 cobalt-precorrin 5B C1-methyltransferase [Methanobrevibacter olleyae]
MADKRLVNQKLLNCGYTTGTCAAAAAKASAEMLFSKELMDSVSITTPNQTKLTLDVLNPQFNDKTASCSIEKDSGDDPDITNGILVSAELTLVFDSQDIIIEGGKGVGRVTKPGLDQPVGESAINSVPRKMIKDSLNSLAKENDYDGGFHVLISVPKGEEITKKTFNPELGIVDGISILGTTGIVEPMSAKALADSIKLEINMISAENNESILIFLGNFGKKFTIEDLNLSTNPGIMCSNFIDVALDSSVEYGFKKILLIGHIGKFVKLGIGMFNTHSNNGDGRIETLLSCALEAGANLDILKEIQNCVTTSAVLDILWENDLLNKTMVILKNRIEHNINKRIPPEIEVGFICFINTGDYSGILFESENASNLKEIWSK